MAGVAAGPVRGTAVSQILNQKQSTGSPVDRYSNVQPGPLKKEPRVIQRSVPYIRVLQRSSAGHAGLLKDWTEPGPAHGPASPSYTRGERAAGCSRGNRCETGKRPKRRATAPYLGRDTITKKAMSGRHPRKQQCRSCSPRERKSRIEERSSIERVTSG